MQNNRYKIIRTKDPNIIKFILPYIEKTIQKAREDYSVESFLKWFRISINNPLVGTWVVIKKGNKLLDGDSRPIAYAIATINSNLVEEYVNITHLYSEDKSATRKLFNVIENWAKENGITKIGGLTKRNPEAWKKAYGFEILYFNLIKEI